MKVAVLGAAGGIGQALALLLKTQLPSGSELSLYDIAPVTPGVAVDLSHIPTAVKIKGFSGEDARPALQGADVVLIDTAGRLHNKVNLMNELKKIKEVMKKVMPEAPDEVMLVLDGSTGQNAFEQAKQFAAVTNISSLAITKLDGTAKGGVVIGISDQLKVPVKYIGLGEGMEDLQLFNKVEFVDSLFKKGK